MKILITGSTGFVGRHLLPKLFGQHEILELTIEPEVSQKLYDNQTKKITITNNQEELKDTIKSFNPDIVIHLASFLTSLDDYDTMKRLFDTNIFFLGRLLDAIKDLPIKLFINTGTFAEYYKGDNTLQPAYLYAATKTASRSLLDYYSLCYNFKYTTVVPYTIYGGDDTQKKIVDIVYDSLYSDTPIDLTPGNQILDFIHVDDVTDFYKLLIDNHEIVPHKQNFQLGTGKGTTLKEIASTLEKKTGKKTNINWGGKNYRQTDVLYAIADTTHQHNLFQWKPKIGINDGIEYFLIKKNNE